MIGYWQRYKTLPVYFKLQQKPVETQGNRAKEGVPHRAVRYYGGGMRKKVPKKKGAGCDGRFGHPRDNEEEA